MRAADMEQGNPFPRRISMCLSACARALLSIGLFLVPAWAQHPAAVANPAAREQNAAPAVRQQLQTLRELIAAKRLTFTVGYTPVVDRPHSLRTGLDLLPPDQLKAEAEEQDRIAARVVAKESEALVAFEKAQQAAGKPPLPE